MADFVAKLDEKQLARNIRIEAREFLNQHRALERDLESIFRAGVLKIVLQQNRPDSEVAECADDFRFLGYSGLVVFTLPRPRTDIVSLVLATSLLLWNRGVAGRPNR